MRCPFCSNEDTQVVDTRSNEGTNVIRRRRKCPKCDKRFTTYERVELRMPRLVKKGGSRTDFDREKLANLIADVLEDPQGELTQQRVTREVKAMCAKFPVYI